ncbi:putative secreted protein [Ereboglobus sp. PH5-5]|uniref:protease inhibitor I42 family protein n=1 Tax=Ereboglobus sp. PH5-5 TaxID=2940529 RepID=UPI002406B7FA|nr:protease inhibitor I42 family protein [Ereboglobus sp. PH5-5]MDF9832711.1 putative secreted protein [Ereboglobus sp. PH5-5]
MKKLTLIISIAAAALAPGGCSKSARMPHQVSVVQKNDEPSKDATIVLGDVLVIEMPGDMAAGYMWELRPLPPDVAGMALIEGRYSNPSEAGKPGKFTYLMRTIHIGEQPLEFIYRHAAQKDRPPVKTFTVNVRIK